MRRQKCSLFSFDHYTVNQKPILYPINTSTYYSPIKSKAVSAVVWGLRGNAVQKTPQLEGMGLDSSGHWGTPHVADPVENAVYYHQRTRIFRYVQHIKLGLWSLKFLCLHSKVMYRQKASSVWVTETIPSNSAGPFLLLGRTMTQPRQHISLYCSSSSAMGGWFHVFPL